MEVWTIWDAELGYSPMHFQDGDEAKRAPMGAEPLWGLKMVRPDGESMLGMMPHSTMEWRAAEYCIDPDDIDTILDVILHEPWIPAADDPFAAQNPKLAEVIDQIRDMPTCWTRGVSDQDRRDACLAKIALVKESIARVDPAPLADRQGALAFVGSDRAAPSDPLAPVKATRLDPIRVESRRLAVEWQRRTVTHADFYNKPAATFLGMLPAGAG
ncbi:hypothetical protein AB0I81_29840 [Nonomuraea sp. NPDC050404]|uniref:hypothetical protein n=1 Tax=Nonomuraea sp. NPDC050404 TaxID=3155783 RepID=UPI0033E6E206